MRTRRHGMVEVDPRLVTEAQVEGAADEVGDGAHAEGACLGGGHGSQESSGRARARIC